MHDDNGCWWGLSKVLQLSNIILFELLHSSDSCVVNRHYLTKFVLTILLDSISTTFLFLSYSFFCLYTFSNDSDLFLLNIYLNDFLSCLFLGLSELRHEDIKLLLENSDLFFGISKLANTSIILQNNRVNLIPLFTKKILECFDKYKIGCWGNIVVSLVLSLIFCSEFGDSHLHINTNTDNTINFW